MLQAAHIDDTVVPEKLDFAAYSTSASFIQAMSKSGGTEEDCRTFATTTITAIEASVKSAQETLDIADKGEECAQEGMATLWHKAHLFDPTRASVATWIFTIARNRRIDILRKQRRPEPEDLTWGPEAEPDQADVLALQQETQILGQALTALPAAQRELIEQAYFGDMSHSEIAKKTGLPLGTIKSRIRLALERLRQQMK